jgi:acyl transferase domain-containing protein
MLLEGRPGMTEMPNDRFNLEAYYHPDSEKPGMVSPTPLFRAIHPHILLQIDVRGAHLVRDDIAVFDAPFFSLTTPAEAGCMDPQQ